MASDVDVNVWLGDRLFGSQTFAGADGLTGDDYAIFFGELPLEAQQPPGRDRMMSHEDMPAAYAGRQNRYISTTLDGLIAVDNGWPTTVAAPLEYTEDLKFSWNTYTWNQPLIDQQPHETVPELIKYSRETRHAESIRRAVALQFEHGFMTQMEGLFHYAMALQQIKLMVHRTNSFGAIYALERCHMQEQKWQEMNGFMSMNPMDRANRERWQFGVVQKDPKGLALLRDQASKAVPSMDMVIIPPGLGAYFTVVPVERTTFFYAGYAGQRGFTEGPYPFTKFQGVNVFETPLFDPRARNDRPGLLEREVCIGEHFVMRDHLAYNDQSRRQTADRSVQYFDEDTDNFAVMHMEEALKGCCRFDPETGELDGVHDQLAQSFDAKDMFTYRASSDGRPRKTLYWGQMTRDALQDRTIENIVANLVSKVSQADRNAIEAMLQFFESIVTDAADVAQDTYAEFAKLKDPTSAFAWAKKRLDAAAGEIVPGFASYFALEVYAEYGKDEYRDVCKKGLAAFHRFMNLLMQTFPPALNLVLDEKRCPHNLAKFVRNKHACNLFERVFSFGTVPLFAVDAAGKLSIDPSISIDVESYYKNLQTAAATVGGMSEMLDAAMTFARELHARNQELKKRDLPLVLAMGLDAISNGSARRLGEWLAKFDEDVVRSSGLNLGDPVGSAERAAAVDKLDEKLVAYFTALVQSVPAANEAHARAVSVIFSKKDVPPPPAVPKDVAFVATPLVASFASGQTVAAGTVLRVADHRRGFVVPAENNDSLSNATSAPYKELRERELRVPSKYRDDAWAASAAGGGGGGWGGDDARLGTGMRGATSMIVGFAERSMMAPTPIRSSDVRGQTDLDAPLHFVDCPNFVSRYNAMLSMSDRIARAAYACVLYGRITHASCKAFLDSNVPAPYGFLCVRPWMKYVMSTLIWMKGGPQTAKTYFGHANFMFGQDARVKMLFGHFSYYARTIVHNESNVYLTENVFYRRACGGGGSRVFTEKELKVLRSILFKHNGRRTGDVPSFIVMMIPAHEIVPSLVDIRGFFSGSQDKEPLYTSAQYYGLKHGFGDMHSSPLGTKHFERGMRVNTTSWWGYQGNFNPATGNHDQVHENEGHHGPRIGPGCTRVRNGEMVELPRQTSIGLFQAPR